MKRGFTWIAGTASGRAVAAGGGLLLLGLAFIPLEVPYSLAMPGRILGIRQLTVSVNTDGAIVTSLVDHSTGVTRRYTAAQFTRGDAVRFTTDGRVGIGHAVQPGDTLGTMWSNEVERELTRLRGEHASASASLASILAGEKSSIVAVAVQEVEHERRVAEEQNDVFARQKQLFERGLIAQQDFDLARRQAEVAAIDVAMAESRLEATLTGAKAEEANLARAQVRSIQEEIAVLEERQEDLCVISPMAGVIVRLGGEDALLVLVDTSAYVVVFPIPLRERRHVALEQDVSLSTPELDDLPPAAVASLGGTVQFLNGEQVVLGIARCKEGSGLALHGLVVRCALRCSPVAPVEYVRRSLHSLVRR